MILDSLWSTVSFIIDKLFLILRNRKLGENMKAGTPETVILMAAASRRKNARDILLRFFSFLEEISPTREAKSISPVNIFADLPLAR